MKTIAIRATGALVVAALLTVAGVATSASAASPQSDTITLTNQQRAGSGLPALIEDATLDAAAQAWADEMSRSNQMVHSSNEWRAARIPAGWNTNGENIAYGYPSASSVVGAWMNSKGHRENILRTSYTHIGVGYVTSGNYWVQIFAGYAKKGPWPIFRPAYSPAIYELVTANGVSTPTPIDYNRWMTVYGGQRPAATPTDYVKYPWSPTLYAVTFWPGGETKWQWDALSFTQWNYAGRPNARNAGWIAGSEIYKWGTGSELFLKAADATVHRLNYREWVDTGSRAFQDRAGSGYLKLTWNSNIVFTTDSSSASQGEAVDFPKWVAAATPTPLQRVRFAGDAFYKYQDSVDIYYSGPTLNRAITFTEWLGAGMPVPETRLREVK